MEMMRGLGSNLYFNFNYVTVGIHNIEFTNTSSPRANTIIYYLPFTVKGVLYRITADSMPCLPVSCILGSLISPHYFIGSNSHKNELNQVEGF